MISTCQVFVCHRSFFECQLTSESASTRFKNNIVRMISLLYSIYFSTGHLQRGTDSRDHQVAFRAAAQSAFPERKGSTPSCTSSPATQASEAHPDRRLGFGEGKDGSRFGRRTRRQDKRNQRKGQAVSGPEEEQIRVPGTRRRAPRRKDDDDDERFGFHGDIQTPCFAGGR